MLKGHSSKFGLYDFCMNLHQMSLAFKNQALHLILNHILNQCCCCTVMFSEQLHIVIVVQASLQSMCAVFMSSRFSDISKSLLGLETDQPWLVEYCVILCWITLSESFILIILAISLFAAALEAPEIYQSLYNV